MTALELAQLCADIYAATGHKFVIYDAGGVYVGLLSIGDEDLFVFRGSDNTGDWLNDFDAIPVKHPQLGWCHRGMLAGIDAAYSWAKTKRRAGAKASFTGHSLGGAHARLMAGRFIVDGLEVGSLTTFGSPKPAFKKLKDIISGSKIAHTSYRHLSDIVPTEPPSFPLPYVHTEDWVELTGDPAGGLSAIENHLIQNYISALTAQVPAI